MINIWQQLALLFAGALASVVGTLLFKSPATNKLLLTLSLVVILLILYGSDTFSKMYHRFNLLKRRTNKMIGILNDMDWNRLDNNEISAWTNISPENWKNAIEEYVKINKVKIKVKLITTKDNLDPYNAILNPYGGVYPEQDLKQFDTLSKIFTYVSQGGIFINVTDVPGYWAYNPLLRRRLDTTPQIYAINKDPTGQLILRSIRPFELTPFMEKLGIRVFNSENVLFKDWQFENKFNGPGGQLKINVGRAVIVERNVVPIISPQKINEKDVTPLFYVYYGNGKFLISLIWPDLEKHPDTQFQDLLNKLIFKELMGN